MTYGVDDTASGAEPPAAASMGVPNTAKPPPGWYPDPGDSTHHRFWNGEVWTADTFPNGPASAWTPPSVPPPPAWNPPSDPTTPVPVLADLPTETGPRRSGRAVVAIAVVVGLIVGFLGAVTVHYTFGRHSASNATAPVTTPAVTAPSRTAPSLIAPSTTPPSATAPVDPAQSVLSGLVISQADVTASMNVQVILGGRQVGAGQPTLDLCNGNFPSESLRTARLQVAEVDAPGSVSLSTEAVMYANPAATAQAFAELKTTAANCPATPVASRVVVGSAVTTHFNGAPDSAWAQTPTVERLAYDFVATDETGQSQHFVSVYLRRGRILMGVYFAHPDGAQPAINGQTAVAGIVDLLAKRIAQLPASVVNGG